MSVVEDSLVTISSDSEVEVVEEICDPRVSAAFPQYYNQSVPFGARRSNPFLQARFRARLHSSSNSSSYRHRDTVEEPPTKTSCQCTYSSTLKSIPPPNEQVPECCICLSALASPPPFDDTTTTVKPDNYDRVVALTCGHTFHYHCVARVDSYKPPKSRKSVIDCPRCKAQVELKNSLVLFL
ncbi:hypothetical protein GEMRC1_003854 [Eukaryota sp. GEM-RC1]